MTASHQDFLDRWHRVVFEKDLDALWGLLATDVSIGAPPYWDRIRGREVVHHLLGLILNAIEGFTYHREWREAGELALEFRGRVGALDLQGIDLISLNDRFLVQDLDVLIRPANAVDLLREIVAPQMAEFLGRRGGAAT